MKSRPLGMTTPIRNSRILISFRGTAARVRQANGASVENRLNNCLTLVPSWWCILYSMLGAPQPCADRAETRATRGCAIRRSVFAAQFARWWVATGVRSAASAPNRSPSRILLDSCLLPPPPNRRLCGAYLRHFMWMRMRRVELRVSRSRFR